MSNKARNESGKTFGETVCPAPSLEALVAATRNHGVCTDFGTLKVPTKTPVQWVPENNYHNVGGAHVL